ncbi:MAG TPA: hypothetical protein VF950_29180 [Planctomycetota bacterium]
MSPLAWGIVLFVAGLVLSTALTLGVLLSLPADHFTRDKRSRAHLVLVILKNLLGVVLVVLGIGLSVPGVPGQGFLTIFAGLLLLDIPGKRRFELSVLRRPSIRGKVDALRRRFRRPPLQFP